MKKSILFLFACYFASYISWSQTKQSTNTIMVNALIQKMTLEEKIGQMAQINLNVIAKNGFSNQDASIDPAALNEAINKYGVGSILNVVSGAYSIEQWNKLIGEIQDVALKSKNKIPVLYGIDAIHGATYTQNATLFPHNIAEAASRNVELVKAAAKVTAKEVRASAIRWNFDPVLDLGRQPLWSRFPETFGEDPYIVGEMGKATVLGYEEDGLNKTTSVASCVKHFIGYSASVNGKDRTPIYMSEVQLREYYLPQFKKSIEAGAASIMINSADINGTPVHANKYLLTNVLRGELKFKGLTVTDWEDIKRLHTRHKVAATPKEAVRLAIEAGIDMSMIPFDYSFCNYLIELVKEGAISEQRINESVTRILELKYKLGLFDNAYGETEAKKQFGLPEYQKTALASAQEAITLLKNDAVQNSDKAILPLAKNSKILIAGPGANSVSNLNGCWSFTWQGDDNSKYPASYKNIFQAISDKTGSSNVINIIDHFKKDGSSYNISELTAQAKLADYIILCLGEDAHAESPGSIWDLTLDANQLELAKAAIATGKPVILVLTEGRPRIIKDIVPGMKAILQAYWPGSQGAQAIADVLFGDVNPSGKLPYTYPQFTGMFMSYDYKYSELEEELKAGEFTLTGYRPQWPFGYGLSYTTFSYSNLQLSTDKLKADETLTVSVDITNTGRIAGKETVELYSKDLYASLVPCERRLRRFTKISLNPGEKKTVNFTINKSDLAFVNANLQTVTEDGDFEIIIDKLVKGFNYRK